MIKHISLTALLFVFLSSAVYSAATSSSSVPAAGHGPEHEHAPKKPSKRTQMYQLKELDKTRKGSAHYVASDEKARKNQILSDIRTGKTPRNKRGRLQLQHVNLDGVKIAFGFWDKTLRGADFTGASLMGVSIVAMDMDRVILKGANLRTAVIRAKLNYADLTNADLTDADLYGVELKHANLSGVDFNRANLTKVDLTGANLTGAKNLDKAIGYSPRPEHELGMPSPSPKHEEIMRPENEISNRGG